MEDDALSYHLLFRAGLGNIYLFFYFLESHTD